MSIAGGHHKAVWAAHRIGFTTVQLFTKSNHQWKAKPLDDKGVRAFQDAFQETGVSSPVAHTSYLINLASGEAALWKKSIDALTVELERAEALGIADLVLHPGSHGGAGEEAGLERVAAALDRVHERTEGIGCFIDLETTAGQGTSLGACFEHLSRIREWVSAPDRLAVCVDTCHIFAAGYRLGAKADYNRTIKALDRIVGLGLVRVWHLNDSQKDCGSRVDRHAGLGRGRIGLDAFGWLVTDPRLADVPMILETPKGTEEGEELDAINLRVLQRLEAGRGLKRSGTGTRRRPSGG